MAALEEAIHCFGEAWGSGDLLTLDALLSPSYTHNDANGEFLRHDAWLAYAAKADRPHDCDHLPRA